MANLEEFPRHVQYDHYLPKWQLCIDCIDGSDAVKEAGKIYLPKGKSQTPSEYDAYKKRALFFNATARTHTALVGAVMRKNPIVNVPDVLKDRLESITDTGMPFSVFAHSVVSEQLATGRCAVLVDRSPDEADNNTYLSLYRAEDILNWRTWKVGGKEVLNQVILREWIDVPTEFGSELGEQVRVLSVTPESGYTQRVYLFEEGTGWRLIQEFSPTILGNPLESIPIQFLSPVKNTWEVEKPPLLDLAYVNISHYQTSADRESALYKTSIPTMVVSGQTEGKQEYNVGSDTAIVLPEGATASYLETAGKGIGDMNTALQSKERQMAVLGARMLDLEKLGVEAADTVRLRQAGEAAILASISHSTSRGLTKCLELVRDWEGVSGEVSVEMNTDFSATKLPPQELAGYIAAYNGGVLDKQSFLNLLKKGELVPHDADISILGPATPNEPQNNPNNQP